MEQEKTPLFETPRLTVSDLLDKINVLRAQINNLVTIAKRAEQKPPVKKAPPPKEENKTNDEKSKEEKLNPEETIKVDPEETLEKMNQTNGDQLDTSKTNSKVEKEHTEL